MDSELETIFSDWEILENENIAYNENRKNIVIYLILSFLNLMAYYMRLIVDYLEKQKKKIDKQYYSIDDLD
jgi:hypothetical protein